MSSSNDFREWLKSKDPKVVRSLVLDAYSSDRKFLRAFEKVVDSDLSCATGKSWAQLFSAATDWDYQKNATYLLESNDWDSASKLTLVGILNIIAYFLNINWKSDLAPSNNPRPDNNDSTTSSTQKAYLEQRKQLQQLERKNQNGKANQRVDDYIHNQTRSQQRAKASTPPVTNEVRDRRGQLVSYSSLNNSPQVPQPQHPWIPFALILIIGFIGLMFNAISESDNGYYREERASREAISERKPEPKPDPISDLELTQARKIQNNAVLICEHKRAITTLRSIRRRTSSQNKKSIAESLISDSNKQINFLSQEGDHEYWEDDACTHGFQWFDENTDTHARGFIAISRKCENPKAVFDFRREDDLDDLIIKQYRKELHRMSGKSGEIQIPWIVDGDQFVFLGDFRCN